MPGPRVPVIATGGGLPTEGQFFPAYKTALRELGVESSMTERKRDRQKLKAGETILRGGYAFRLAPGGPSA